MTDHRLAGDRARAESAALCQKVVDMMKLTRQGFIGLDEGALDAAEVLGGQIHQAEKALIKHLEPTGDGTPNPDAEDYFVAMHLERVGDNLELLAAAIRKRLIRDAVLFTPRARQEVTGLLELGVELVVCIRDAILTDNRTLLRHVLEQCRRYEQQANEFAVFHERRLIEGVCQPKASSVYLAMLDHLKGIEWHVREVGQKISVRVARASGAGEAGV